MPSIGAGLSALPDAASEVSRAPVIDLPRGDARTGVVALSPALSPEDVIQPVIEIERGKTVLLRPSYPVKRIAVGDPEIADFVVNGANEVQLIAKMVGQTNVLLWDEKNRLQAAIDIQVGAVRAQIVRELQRVLGRSDVSVDVAGDSVVLRGTVPDLQTSEAAAAVAGAFFSNQGETGGPRVINLLSVGGNAQVMLEVTIAEMNRSIRRQFGANLDALFGKGGEQLQVTTLVRNLTDLNSAFVANPVRSSSGMTAAVMGMTSNVRAFNVADDVRLIATLVNRDSLLLNVFLEALELTQLGKVLAEPTLVARSGELASFLVGGEIPITVPQDDDSVTIQFKRFGVQLEFIPTVLSETRIHLQVTPEVSQPTNAFGGATVNGLTVPAFRTRRAATGVELADGQSFAIGGLLQESVQSDSDRLPFLGDVPIIGALFRSQRFQRDETELVIIVTPRLVQPLGPGPIALPGDDYVDPSRLDLFLLGPIVGKPPTQGAALRRSGTSKSNAEEPKGGLIGDFGHRLRIPRPGGTGS